MHIEKGDPNMPQLQVNLALLVKLIDQLNDREKIKLVRKLEAKTLPARWKSFLRQVDQRRKKHPVNQAEIEETVEKVRQKIHERSGR